MINKDQIQAALTKFRLSAQLPTLVLELETIGVVRWGVLTSNGSQVFFGLHNDSIEIPQFNLQDFECVDVADEVNRANILASFKDLQEGSLTDFQFLQICAECGIERIITNIPEQTIIYCDRAKISQRKV